MTCIVASYLRCGMVIAADSLSTACAQKWENGESVRECGMYTNNVDKIYLCPNGCAIAVSGDGLHNKRGMSEHMEIFIKNRIKKETDVRELTDELIHRFCGFGIAANLIIAGYESVEHAKQRYLCELWIKDGEVAYKREIEQDSIGHLCIGVDDINRRLTECMYTKNIDDEYSMVKMYDMPWELYTMQDAVDFSRFIVETTVAMQKYQYRPVTVGGPIDILILSPEKSYWLSKKELHI